MLLVLSLSIPFVYFLNFINGQPISSLPETLLLFNVVVFLSFKVYVDTHKNQAWILTFTINQKAKKTWRKSVKSNQVDQQIKLGHIPGVS